MDVSIRKPKPEVPVGTVKSDYMHKLLRKLELKELKKVCLQAKMQHPLKKIPKSMPKKVDYSPQITFVRHQGAWGCGMFARVACWDIMNELACP